MGKVKRACHNRPEVVLLDTTNRPDSSSTSSCLIRPNRTRSLSARSNGEVSPFILCTDGYEALGLLPPSWGKLSGGWVAYDLSHSPYFMGKGINPQVKAKASNVLNRV